ncbi:MAG: hypothetical protein GAK35_03736 [Herbaspirillum frisingense]|uniref:Uncharacterized protein n=1 Tax=Herbaspirillum frisingense TaxID=92645 RepID=A0A7V8FTR2_9BURK|nr:MAG: hypothetical protein GAK35_03736 [Herbaspirillum frisingense]
MATIYVNDLAGMHLDFWVARAENLDATRVGGACLRGPDAGAAQGQPYSPTQDAVISNALIERYRVDVFESGGRWAAELAGHDAAPWGNGATPVEAALRAIVAARFGDTVEDEAQALPRHCFWLAFAESGAEPARLLGHAILEAADMNAAVERARQLGMHPGSDARVYRVNDEDAHHIPAAMRNRLLTSQEAAALGWGAA